MQTDAATKLRINLARWNCFSLRIATEATLEEDVTKFLAIDSRSKVKRLYEEYTRSKVVHSMTLRCVRHEGQQNRYGVRLIYETEEPEELVPKLLRLKIKPTSPTPSEGFLQLCSQETSLLFRCTCSFLYRRGDEGIQFVLPIKIDDELFDEVRAIRFVKLQQDKILLENSLDLIEDDLMVHRIMFVHEGKCSVGLPQKLLKQARAISQRT